MRHRVERNKLGRTSAHREAMLRNMVTSLLEYERIETTLAKAKEVRRLADRMITLAKKGDLHSFRLTLKVVRKKQVAHKLFKEMALLFSDRTGGYTRILKVGSRPGDNASMAIVELVSKTRDKKAKKKTTAKTAKKSAMQSARDAVSKKAVKKEPDKKPTAGKKLSKKKEQADVKEATGTAKKSGKKAKASREKVKKKVSKTVKEEA